eukprot:4815608-Lingulodinium_polyedra.AAC.1
MERAPQSPEARRGCPARGQWGLAPPLPPPAPVAGGAVGPLVSGQSWPSWEARAVVPCSCAKPEKPKRG